MPESIDCASYQVTDSFFGAPYIDVDEWRETPLPYRHVHGGFADCDTRFTLYFPEQEAWQGRSIMPLEGAHAGHEDAFGGPMGDLLGGLALHVRLGGYMVESNMGHIGDDVDPKAGDDPTIYGWRAAAETARFSKHVAAQVYGVAPHHSYVWGGSGGGRRSPLCLENAPDAFDGALPFMGGGNVVPFPATEKVKSGQPIAFACMFNLQRLLRHGDKPARLVDAMQPGGSGNPFEGLNSHEREELVYLYEQGFPFGDEHMIFSPMGQIWLWTSIADLLVEQDPTYFTNFWTEPGYIGHDLPAAVEDDVIDVVTTVSNVITVHDLMTDPAYDAPEFMMARVMATIMGGATPDKIFAIEIAGLPEGYRLGAGVQLVSGEATPASPRGNRITLSTKADGLCRATGTTTGITRARTAITYRPTARRRWRSAAANRARKTTGQAVNLRVLAAPSASPASTGRRRCRATSPSSMSATTGMSSPPVARGSAAVGRTVRAWSDRMRASDLGRTRVRAKQATMTVNRRNWIRASVSRASTLLPLEKPKTTIPGRYG